MDLSEDHLARQDRFMGHLFFLSKCKGRERGPKHLSKKARVHWSASSSSSSSSVREEGELSGEGEMGILSLWTGYSPTPPPEVYPKMLNKAILSLDLGESSEDESEGTKSSKSKKSVSIGASQTQIVRNVWIFWGVTPVSGSANFFCK